MKLLDIVVKSRSEDNDVICLIVDKLFVGLGIIPGVKDVNTQLKVDRYEVIDKYTGLLQMGNINTDIPSRPHTIQLHNLEAKEAQIVASAIVKYFDEAIGIKVFSIYNTVDISDDYAELKELVRDFNIVIKQLYFNQNNLF